MGTMVYNVNNTATQVLAAKQVKENIFMELLHRNGKGVNQIEETNASTVRMFKPTQLTDSARTLGAATNGGFFNNGTISASQVTEYDLNLLYVYDQAVDIPEVQQDMCPINLFDNVTKNLGGRIATEINASTFALQLAEKYNAGKAATKWDDLAIVLAETPDYYGSYLDASSLLDNGDEANGVQSFPFEEREFLMTSGFRRGLMSSKGVLVGGSNYAQSMLAKGAVSPEDKKEFGSMYIGEIDLVPCYLVPSAIWARANIWAGGTAASNKFAGVQGVLCAAQATDRGISTQDYIKVIDSPVGAGKRLQPKTRWGVNITYSKGIVPILANGTTVPLADITVVAPGSQAQA